LAFTGCGVQLVENGTLNLTNHFKIFDKPLNMAKYYGKANSNSINRDYLKFGIRKEICCLKTVKLFIPNKELLLLFKLRRIQRQPSQLLRYLEFSIEKW
jgi:hypothetical protein